jgi:hypothetical protein
MKVVSLSPKELAVLSDGTTRIYRRGLNRPDERSRKDAA